MLYQITFEINGAVWALIPAMAIVATYFLGRNGRSKIADKIEIVSIKTDQKLEEIHILVNSRLTEALEEIIKLRNELHVERGEAIETKDGDA